MEAEGIAEMDGDAEVVEAASGATGFVCAAEVEDKASVVAEFAVNNPGELREPLDVFLLAFVAVFLLALESKGGTGEDEIDTGIRQAFQEVQRVAAVGGSPIGDVCGRGVFQMHDATLSL